jgi:GNAT superfamily N-acetyltransferase
MTNQKGGVFYKLHSKSLLLRLSMELFYNLEVRRAPEEDGMKLKMRTYKSEDDFWQLRNFLREVFLLNDRLEHSWSVSRLDYWRWHLIQTCRVHESVEQGIMLWENSSDQLAAAVTSLGGGEIRLHIQPQMRSAQLQDEMLAWAEEHVSGLDEDGRRYLILPVDVGDLQLQETLISRGYVKGSGISRKWRRDLDAAVPDAPISAGYVIRSMGGPEEYPARSWASWRAFHSDEGDENYDGDSSWYGNLQSAPLYRRDLDLVAEAPEGGIAAFCVIFYDDYTRSAVCVQVGTAAEHWRRGLGKAVILEGMRRLQRLGCTRVFATAYEEPANALYGSVMQEHIVGETWYRMIPD